MTEKQKKLLTWLVVVGICAVLAGLYINLTIIHYQANTNWAGDCLIAVIWSLAALVSAWRIYGISFKNYQENKSDK